MKIQYCSDLHLEFDANNNFLKKNPLVVGAELLILAGDIIPLHEEYFTNNFFDWISEKYKMVYWIPGNHEFYHKDLMEFPSSLNIKIRENVFVVNNIDLIYNNVHFIFSALWSNISQINARIVEQNVSDFDCILIKDKKMKATDFNHLHHESLSFIKKVLGNHLDLSKVVVTHHVPSMQCNLPMHNSSIINEAFCVDLTDFITNSGVNFWIYGHSHFNQKPTIIGKTLLLTNQLGYVHLSEEGSFKNNAYFSV